MRTRIHRAEHESAASLHAKVNSPRLGMSQTVLDAIGRTPLLPLHRLSAGVPAKVLVKLESSNPGGSIKDRVGVAMVEEAERSGWLLPGGTIIEATAGNTGVGLALAASVKGYRCIFVLPDKMSGEKIRLLKAYGAEIVITPTAVPPDSPESYNGVAERLARDTRGMAAQPIRQSGQPRDSLSNDRPGDLGTDRWQNNGFRLRGRDRRHHLGRRPVPERTQRGDQSHRGRSGGLGPFGRRTQAVEGRGNRRGFRTQDVEWPGRGRVDPDRRRRELSHGARHGAARRAFGRRLVRHGRRGRAAVCPAALRR